VIEGIKVASLDTCPAEVALIPIIDSNIPAFGPGALAAQFLRGAERVAITGTAVADGVQTALPPLAVGGVHQPSPVGAADEFYGLFP
jgi:hypothetical protein